MVIANLAGSVISDYCQAAEKLDGTAVDMIELNISCPNVKQGGASFGTSCTSAQEITAAVRKVTSKPLIVKLTPNVTSISEIAAAVEAAGADAVSLINTLTGMRINIKPAAPCCGTIRAACPARRCFLWRCAWCGKRPGA